MRRTDGRTISNPENVQSFSHQAIKDAADKMNPEALHSALDSWSSLSNTVTKAGEQFETAITKTIEQHWEGATADKAVQSIRDFVLRVAEFGNALDQQKDPLAAAASAAALFKAAVPAPVTGATAEVRNELEQQARDDMSTYYVQPYSATAPTIPTLPPPVDVVATPSDTAPVVGPAVDDSGQPQTPSATPTDSDSSPDKKPTQHEKPEDKDKPENPGKPEEQAKSDDKGKSPDSAKQDAVAPQSVSNTQPVPATQPVAVTQPVSFTPSTDRTSTTSYVPTVPPSRVSTAPASVDTPPSRTGTPHAPGSTHGTPNAPSTPAPHGQPGISRAPQPVAPAAAAQPTVPVKTGTTGGAGYSGFLPPGVAARREQDDAHKSAKYLRSEENAKKLLGEVEKTVPPVFGA